MVPAARSSLGCETFLMLVTGGPPIFGGGGMHDRIDVISRPSPVHMIKLTETREITPYKWVHPDEER